MYNASVHMSKCMDVFQPLADLLVRVFVGWQFFKAGLTKISNPTHSKTGNASSAAVLR